MKSISIVVAVGLLAAAAAQAAGGVDTGTPDGNPIGAYALDAVDSYAGEIVFSESLKVSSVAFHVLGGGAGESFTVALYDDSAAHAPGNLLYSVSASYVADGWNGVAGLTGWAVTPGHYWAAIEVGPSDTLGGGSATGALLDRGVPFPLARTAFNAGSGYALASSAQDFGLRAAAVPEPATAMMLLGGLGLVGVVSSSCRRRARGAA